MEVPGQHDVRDTQTHTVCESGDFHCASSVLCPACSTNQVLYVRQLATFKAMSEDSYDEELESYREYLDEVYRLCPTCDGRVKERIAEQDQLLQSKMSPEQLERLTAVGRKPSSTAAGRDTSRRMPRLRAPCLPTLLFICCFFLATVHAVICLRLYAVSVVSRTRAPVERNTSWFSRWMLWLVATVPAGKALAAQVVVVYLGAITCMAGLFTSGKYSLYLEDCLHLLLWLSKLIAWVEWVSLADGPALALSVVTATLALVSCLRPRRPMHLSPQLFFRKDVKNVRLSKCKKICEASETSPPKSPSPDLHENKLHCSSTSSSCSQFEDVRQDLETFSIGLGKKSSSKSSSIWSLPAAVVSSREPDSQGVSLSALSELMSPDSTTEDQIFTPRPGTPRSVLSPSRLGFLSFDSNTAGVLSPWNPMMENSSSSFSSPHEDSGALLSSRPGSPFQEAFLNTRPISEGQKYQGSLTLHHGLWKRVHPSQPSSRSPDPFPPHSSHGSAHGGSRDVQRSKNRHRPLSNTTGLSTLPEQFDCDCLHLTSNSGYHAQPEPVPVSGIETIDQRNSSLGEAPGVRRRSQRLAQARKLPKPWPLRKSLSCNNATDFENVEKAGNAARLEMSQASIQSSSPQTVHKDSMCDPSQDFIHHDIPCRPMTVAQNSPQQWITGLPSSKKVNEQFLQYRDTSGGAKLPQSQTLQPSCGIDSALNSRERNLSTNTPTSSISRGLFEHGCKTVQSEFSDDEEMEVEEHWDVPARRKQKTSSLYGRGGDTSLRWILIGSVIGASVTCNVFLLLHGHLQH
ncbi:hypothetical protein EGW08_009739 [Elysia chlorotica]|uniref:Ima1 N-terminal domain-containing protein n=1 Tax=Elysia chlorotica TaxID=188477 RepID=A0A3S0ZP62_ELYCH|nr:hypothetical protein EGW08_009739 [Elysia chlorotica]